MTERRTEIRYKCHCMPEEVSIFVRARTENDNIALWMKTVAIHEITEDHKRRCPTCSRDTMQYAKILIAQDLIGGAPKLH